MQHSEKRESYKRCKTGNYVTFSLEPGLGVAIALAVVGKNFFYRVRESGRRKGAPDHTIPGGKSGHMALNRAGGVLL